MSQGWRWVSAALLSVQAVCLSGCFGMQSSAFPVQRESLAADLAREESPRLARLQQAEVPALKVPVPASPLTPQLPMLRTTSPQVPPPPTNSVPGAQQTNLTVPAPRVSKITVRAWVNGKPIFDDEVMQNIPPAAFRELNKMPATQQAEKLTEYFNQTLDQLIEQEVIYQEAVRKLEKMNPTTLTKLRNLAEQDFEKQLQKVRDTKKVSDEQLKEFQRQMRRQAERSFISMEYMRSRIFQLINSGIGFQEIKDYYDSHPNEFQRVESVRWQDVFLAVGPKYPTLADARRYAEDLIAQCRTGDDFIKLMAYDDGDSKFRNGEGAGSRRGDIRPAELEEHLFRMRNGEIGPVVELSTGVHIFRLAAREAGGQIPLNEAVQNQIKSKLRNQLADREYRRIVRELKSRAVIEVERDAG